MIFSIQTTYPFLNNQDNSNKIQRPSKQELCSDKKVNLWFLGKKRVTSYDNENLSLFHSDCGLHRYNIISPREDNFINLHFDILDVVFSYDRRKIAALPITESKEKEWENDWSPESKDLLFRTGWDESEPSRFDGKVPYHQTNNGKKLIPFFIKKGNKIFLLTQSIMIKILYFGLELMSMEHLTMIEILPKNLK